MKGKEIGGGKQTAAFREDTDPTFKDLFTAPLFAAGERYQALRDAPLMGGSGRGMSQDGGTLAA